MLQRKFHARTSGAHNRRLAVGVRSSLQAQAPAIVKPPQLSVHSEHSCKVVFDNLDVAIVGGGPAGLATAAALLQAKPTLRIKASIGASVPCPHVSRILLHDGKDIEGYWFKARPTKHAPVHALVADSLRSASGLTAAVVWKAAALCCRVSRAGQWGGGWAGTGGGGSWAAASHTRLGCMPWRAVCSLAAQPTLSRAPFSRHLRTRLFATCL